MGQHYPSWRFHSTHAPVIVQDPTHEAEVAPADEGWCELVRDLPDPAVAPPAAPPLPVVEDQPPVLE